MLDHFLIGLYLAIALFEAPAYVMTELAADPRLSCQLIHIDRDAIEIPTCERVTQRSPQTASVVEWREIGFYLVIPR